MWDEAKRPAAAGPNCDPDSSATVTEVVTCAQCGDPAVPREEATRAYRDAYGSLHRDPGAMAARYEIYLCTYCADEAGAPGLGQG